ncbi:MAG TPA: hypothetical protein DCG47_09870 [Spirochaetaceae bacterium]|nr:hypothetical protein [Spirochaetaceae bacterium]
MAKKSYGLLKALFLLALLAALAYGSFYLLTRAQRGRIASLEESILALQEETVPLRFMVLKRAEGRLSLRLRLYDLAGAEYASREYELEGELLFLDFLAAPYGQAWLAFPYRIFTERVAPAQGLDLAALVMPGYSPALAAGAAPASARNTSPLYPQSHAGGSFDEAGLAELGRLYAALLDGGQVKGAFGNAVHDLAELRRFELGAVYRVVVRKKGGIEVIEE